MAIKRPLRLLLVLILIAATGVVGGVVALRMVLEPQLPDVEALRDVRLQVPLRVYTHEGKLIAEFGEKRRIPVTIEQVPPTLIQAFLAAEDDRFYAHPGVDYQGLLRAGFELLRTGEKRQGGSTITMQVARNFFLSREKTYLRKLNEILLALKIERRLSKAEILELYLNKIYLGQRAYGVGAAAQIFYGKQLEELTLAEMATIAGLPKAPSRDNPVTNPERARERRNYVLGRMHQLGFIDDDTLAEARAAQETATLHDLPVEVEAPYVAEMVRQEMIDRHGDAAYTDGFNVHTTLRAGHQQQANRALRLALVEYDLRHGYRGPEQRPAQGGSPPSLATIPTLGGLLPARVSALDETSISVEVKDHGPGLIESEGWEWAQPYLSENRRGKKPATPDQVVAVGDLVRVRLDDEGRWWLTQLPAIEGAMVALRPDDGAITALVGGFDFRHSKFNRAVQAQRQPGSGFKPVIYSAALEHGFTTASLINDAPVVFDDPSLETTWRPENYSGKFFGWITPHASGSTPPGCHATSRWHSAAVRSPRWRWRPSTRLSPTAGSASRPISSIASRMAPVNCWSTAHLITPVAAARNPLQRPPPALPTPSRKRRAKTPNPRTWRPPRLSRSATLNGMQTNRPMPSSRSRHNPSPSRRRAYSNHAMPT
jgi:penicillin-binding protein 1A